MNVDKDAEEYLGENVSPITAEINKVSNRSLFAKRRQEKQAANSEALSEERKRIVGLTDEEPVKATSVIGDIVERDTITTKTPASRVPLYSEIIPDTGKDVSASSIRGKSIFAQMIAAELNKSEKKTLEAHSQIRMNCNTLDNSSTKAVNESVIIQDAAVGVEMHEKNTELLGMMGEAEILSARQQLLHMTDPKIVAFLEQMRQKKRQTVSSTDSIDTEEMGQAMDVDIAQDAAAITLSDSHPANELLARGKEASWLNFDVLESKKLEWMDDLPSLVGDLKPGDQFEARFDWKGVLLPYTLKTATITEEENVRDLYLHGNDQHRAGYTLQELFHLARSNVQQQRVSAFCAIGGILNIYNQGFYDGLNLPISKIFFLLRYGFDENVPIMMEVISKSLAFLFYNEADEALLDFIYDNPNCHWQPTMQVLETDASEPFSIENMQAQMKQLELTGRGGAPPSSSIKANVNEGEEESKTSMSDFQLAEIDLIDCLLRTNILQRIYYVLQTKRPNNSTVTSCLKMLIRLARTDKEVAIRIVTYNDLLQCILESFLPGLERVDTSKSVPDFYDYPQYLALKLFRVLISQHSSIALRFLNLNIVQKLENYLFNHDDLQVSLIKVQIESLRILRALILLHADPALFKTFLPAFRYLLEWHQHRLVFDEKGSCILRQHASALVLVVTEVASLYDHGLLLGDVLNNCCCKWFSDAARCETVILSQSVLLSACLNAIRLFTVNDDVRRYFSFYSKYLQNFLSAPCFQKVMDSLSHSSILYHTASDRRYVHPPLPNVGSILTTDRGPQLIISQHYTVNLLLSLCRLTELQSRQMQTVLPSLLCPVVDVLANYIKKLNTNGINRYLATNFFARGELELLSKLLISPEIAKCIESPVLLKVSYDYVCCLTADHIPQIEDIFKHLLFNGEYIDATEEVLEQWHSAFMEHVNSHAIIRPITELSLGIPYIQMPVLATDWPYFYLKKSLLNYLGNIQKRDTKLSENNLLEMTINFVSKLEQCSPLVHVATPTEKLMYFMIVFLTPDSNFLEPHTSAMLRQCLLTFYQQCENVVFDFDAIFEGKCKFENLYILFINHFQAASYGDGLFSSLVLVPMAQKYDNKWRRRVWSECIDALMYLNCAENLLIGGLNAYLEPRESEQSLLNAYHSALTNNLLRPNTLPYRIARHHLCSATIPKN